MRDGVKPELEGLKAGQVLVHQGDRGDDVFVLLDGVISVDVDGGARAEIGPGAVLGERAVLESGRRTARLRAVTANRVAVGHPDQLDTERLTALSDSHRRQARAPG